MRVYGLTSKQAIADTQTHVLIVKRYIGSEDVTPPCHGQWERSKGIPCGHTLNVLIEGDGIVTMDSTTSSAHLPTLA